MVRPHSLHSSGRSSSSASTRHHRSGVFREHPFPMSSIPEEDGKRDCYGGQEPVDSPPTLPHRSPSDNSHLSSWSIASITPSIPDSVVSLANQVTNAVTPYWDAVLVCAFFLGLLIGIGLCYGYMTSKKREDYRSQINQMINESHFKRNVPLSYQSDDSQSVTSDNGVPDSVHASPHASPHNN
jgi:hypothetical protein